MATAKENEGNSFFNLRKQTAPATTLPVILFSAGGSRFAVEASEVREVRDYDEGTTYGKLKGPMPLDFAFQVGLGRGILARCVVLKPGECWLGVSEVERIATLPRLVALPRIFQGAERQWYRGLLLLEEEVVPLVRTDYWRSLAAAEEPVLGGRE
jgi:chemotaxis signal transduction protein